MAVCHRKNEGGKKMQVYTNATTKFRGERIAPVLKKLNSIQTIKYLEEAQSGRDLDMFKSVNVDVNEAAKFIERQAKIMRFVSISARLPTITHLVEEIYYSAFEQSIFREMPDYKEFREILSSCENETA
jgi:hypothetical protein